MTLRRTSLDDRLRQLPDVVLLAIGLAIVAGLTAFRLTVGHGVPVVDFLLIAVVGVGWFASARWYGYALAAVAATASVAMAVAGQADVPLGAAVTSGLARFVLYLVVLGLLGLMRRERTAHQREARTDPHTGVANVRGFRALALTEIERSQRFAHEFSLAYLDVDDLKAINSRLGHVEGDRVLLEVCHVMRSAVRSVDTVARLGGDEFAVLMPETGAAPARAVVDRLKTEFARLRTCDGRDVTCSIGLVTFLRPPASLEELITAGDELMYRAKQNGKDGIEQAEHSGSYAVSN